MTKRQLFSILAKIATSYPVKQTEISQERIDIFYESLQSYDLASVVDMLNRHLVTSKYPPNISDLVPVQKEVAAAVYISELETWENNAASLTDIESILQNTRRKLLGVS